jgi:hypothetical protein
VRVSERGWGRGELASACPGQHREQLQPQLRLELELASRTGEQAGQAARLARLTFKHILAAVVHQLLGILLPHLVLGGAGEGHVHLRVHLPGPAPAGGAGQQGNSSASSGSGSYMTALVQAVGGSVACMPAVRQTGLGVWVYTTPTRGSAQPGGCSCSHTPVPHVGAAAVGLVLVQAPAVLGLDLHDLRAGWAGRAGRAERAVRAGRVMQSRRSCAPVRQAARQCMFLAALQHSPLPRLWLAACRVSPAPAVWM